MLRLVRARLKTSRRSKQCEAKRRRQRKLRSLELLEHRLVLSADLAWVFELDVPLSATLQESEVHEADEHVLTTDIFGNQMYSEPVVDGPQAAALAAGESGDDAVWQGYDLSETFSLHSNPDADHVIYLDFDGHVTSGTAWNDAFADGGNIVTPSFSTDGDSSSFSDSEKALIQRVWARVAEDYSPFDLDVTTEEPPLDRLINSGTGDARWGTRVVIGPNTWFDPAGGVAYVGAFNWSTDAPCFVFNTSENGIAESAAHESGHTLGLAHDGDASATYYTGHGSGITSWGPIMGAPYSANLTQWDAGEYYNANNGQDDLSIIVSQNGFDYRPDDFGDTLNDATALLVAGQSQIDAFYGVIERNNDYDMLSFQAGAGNVSLAIDPLAIGPNLDILAELYNANGTLISSSNPINDIDASFTLSLPTAGNYFLRVSGTGRGDPLTDGYTEYGSLGNYRITGTVTPYIVENTSPVAINDQATTEVNEAITLDVLANDSDANSDPLSVSSVTQASNGSVVINPDKTVTYTPPSTFVGTDSFSYTISDGMGDFDTALVTITVTAPAALANGGFEQGMLGWEVTGDASAQTASFGESPTQGQNQAVLTTANWAGGNITVSNLESFLGLGSGTLETLAPGTATAGSAIRQQVTAVAGQTLVLQYNFATDESTPDSTYNDFSFLAVAGPTGQEAFLLADTAASGFQTSTSTYKQSTGYRQFTYTFTTTGLYTIGFGVSDSKDTSYDTALLVDFISVGSSTNTPPIATNDTVTTTEDQSITSDVLANDYDSDGNTLTISSLGQAAAGTAVLDGNGMVTYAPAADFSGSDSFEYTIVDGQGGQATGTVFVTIVSVNDAPVATDDNTSTTAGVPVVVDVLSNDGDVDGDTLAVVGLTQPSSGSAVVNVDESITYTPGGGFTGQDTFTYTVNDGHGAQSTATVIVSVEGSSGATIDGFENGLTGWAILGDATTRGGTFGEAPVAGQHQALLTTTNSLGGNVVVADLETFLGVSSGSLNATTVGTATAGSAIRRTLNVTAGQRLTLQLSFLTDESTPNSNYNDFAFITVAGPGVDTASLLADTHSVGFTVSPTTYSQSTGYGSYSFTFPSAGQYTIGLGVSDARDTSYDTALLLDEITLSGTTTSTNTPPVAAADTGITVEDAQVAIAVLANDSDPDGDTLTIASVTQGSYGSVVVSAGTTVTYTPQANYHGTDTFTYTVDDGQGGQDTALVTVTVNSMNDAPVAVDDTATASSATTATFSVIANDTDVDGDILTVTAVAQPVNGTVVVNQDNSLSYTPDSGFTGDDSFSYTVGDGQGEQDSASVTVTVTGSTSSLINGGFENVLDGWESTGDASVQTAAFGESPVSGQYQGLVTSVNAAGGNISVANLEVFLGLISGTLDGVTVGTATAGSAIRQTVTVAAGQELVFRYNFVTNENTPDNTYNDFSFLTIVGSGVQTAVLVADTHATSFGASPSVYKSSTGYQSFSYAFSQSGQYTIGFGVADSKDTSYDSALLLDGINLESGAAAAALETSCPAESLPEDWGFMLAASEPLGVVPSGGSLLPQAVDYNVAEGESGMIGDSESTEAPFDSAQADDSDAIDLPSQDWETSVDQVFAKF